MIVDAQSSPISDEAGFSLLELLAALAILSVTLLIVAPSAVNLVRSVEYNSNVRSFERAIESTRTRAFIENQRYSITPTQNRIGVAPPFVDDLESEGWEIDGDPIIFLETGVCIGGELTLTSPQNRIRTISVASPDCSIVQSS